MSLLLAVALQVQLSTAAVRPGDVFTVALQGEHSEGRLVSGFGEARVPCYPSGASGTWYAMHGVPVSSPPGRRDITVGGVDFALRTDSRAPIRVLSSEHAHDVAVERSYDVAVVGSGNAAPNAWQGEIEVLPVTPEEQRLTFVKKRRYLTEKLSPKKQKALKAALHSETPVRRWEGALLRPVEGRTVAEYGVKRVYNRGLRESWHKGLDLKAPWGTPVVAAASGTVALTGSYGANGRIVVLDHGHGVVTFYGHLSRILVKQGQPVSAGQVVGRVGSTGLSTAPHLHWGVYVHGVAVRPNDWTMKIPPIPLP